MADPAPVPVPAGAFTSVTATADRLAVPGSTVRYWLRRGVVPGARRVGRVWQVPEAFVARAEREGFVPDYDNAPAEAERQTAEAASA